MFFICSKSKILKKKRKNKYPHGTRSFFKCSWNEKKCSCYIKLKCEQHCTATWIEFEFYIRYNWIEFKILIWIQISWTEFELNWISIQLSN